MRTYLEKSAQIEVGHLYQERASIWPTKKTLLETTDLLEKETDKMEKDTGNMLTHDICIALEEIKGRVYTYQTFRFPVKYIQGNIYVMVLYDYE